ncbi:MAG: hypothetical protein IKY98_03895 [Alphaproteobacteria bacterium]|nr:hypothetical protein [Alphaproteobacteria bacterium]
MKKGLFVLLFLVVGCQISEPFVDSYSGLVRDGMGRSNTNQVAVCFDKDTPRSKLDEIAEAECQKTSRHAVYLDTTPFTCSLTAPSTIFYQCK